MTLCAKCQVPIKDNYWKVCNDCLASLALAIKADDAVELVKGLMVIITDLSEDLRDAYAMLTAQAVQLKEQQAILDTIEWAS